MPDRLTKLEQDIEKINRFIDSLKSVNAADPMYVQAVRQIIGDSLSLSDLNDVSSTAPSNGQVLKYNGTEWAPGTDIDT
jgi:hypothetical protein